MAADVSPPSGDPVAQLRDLVHQLRAFPTGERDDGPDCLAQLVDVLTAALS